MKPNSEKFVKLLSDESTLTESHLFEFSLKLGQSVKRLSGLLKFEILEPRRRKIDKNLYNGFYRLFSEIVDQKR